MKTLVVEDDLASRLFVQKVLSAYGEVHVAVNGHEATQAIRMSLEENSPYDLVCMDLKMPEMDGHEAIHQIKLLEREAGIPFEKEVKTIILTAFGDIKNVTTGFSAGADAYLVKPLEKAKLLEEVKKLKLI
jgi:two-component system chemotaxis response regulator CheY